MMVIGEPQGIGIYRQIGVRPNGTPIYEGHDLVCYQVSVTGGKLFISDPNIPGTGKLVGQATATASIQKGILAKLQACEAVTLFLDADFISNSADLTLQRIYLGSRPTIGAAITGKWKLTWNGTHFSCNYTEVWYNESEKITSDYIFSGEVSANGLMVKTLNGWMKTVRNQDRDVSERSVTVTDVPFTGACRSGDERCFSVTGPSVQQHVSNPFYTFTGVSHGEPFSYRISGINYNNPDKVPILEISFNL